MDERFESYFGERLVQYQQPIPGARLLPSGGLDRLDRDADELVRTAIDRARPIALARSDAGLRGDAELLLYLAFVELVARPIVAVRGSSGDLAEAIRADVGRIVQRAGGTGPISAHRIVDATSGSWPELRSAAFAIWD